MKKILALNFYLFVFTGFSQTYNFTSIDNLLSSNSNLFNGKVVCMIKHYDTLIYYKAMGGIDSNSVSQIASGTKTFSGALMLRLAQEGLFNLDDSIGQYKPNASLLGKGSSTIRQNFAHTAGWSGNTNYQSSSVLTLQQSADSIIQYDNKIYTPGSSFKYTGVSMHIAGAIAEQLSGTPWNTLFDNKIKTPLGLSNTNFCLNSNNPRIAGGICSSPSDIMKFARFIQQYGKNPAGIQVVDSIWMTELWKDQTNGVPQIGSPYPSSPNNNNPYNASTIYYGIGSWLDIYNPNQLYQEQISGVGAFGTDFWINRCNNITGVLFTQLPTLSGVVIPVWFQIMDVVRNTIPNTCYNVVTSTSENSINQSNNTIYPNPSNNLIYFNSNLIVKEFSVYNLIGQKVISEKNTNYLDISSLPIGVYYIEIIDENLKLINYKFIKQ